MTENQNAFTKSLYDELYAFKDKSIVRNHVTGQICMKKILSVYSISVYEWLKQHHDNHVCSVIDYWKEGDKLIVIEELLSGRTLDYMLENHLLNNEEKKEILKQICKGISFLHHADPPIIHRDLKPSNIMILSDTKAKIIDYNASKLYNPGEKRDTVLIGTEGSAAPEQYGFGASDVRTDIYAIGILIKEMFPDDKEMRRISAKATQMNPDDRYQSIDQILELLDDNPDAIHHHLNIPGFRTGNPVHILAACAGYAAILYFTFTLQFHKAAVPVETWLGRIAFLLISIGWIDLFTNWTGFFEKLPWMKVSKPSLRILSYVLSAFLYAFVILFILALMISFLPVS